MKKLYIYATIQENRYLLEYRELDESGKVTTEIAFHPDGKVYEKVIHTYIGDLILQSNYFSGNDEASHSVSFTYDDTQQITKESTLYADGSLTIRTFTRDEKENDEILLITNEDGQIEGKEYFKYMNIVNKQLPILEIKYDEKGEKEKEKSTYEYNSDGYIKKIHSINAEGVVFIRYFKYQKDDYGNITETNILNDDQKIVGTEKRSFTVDRKPSMLEVFNHYTNQYKKTTWQYDDQGNNTVIRQFNAKGELDVEILLEYNENKQIVLEETRSAFNGASLKEYVYEY